MTILLFLAILILQMSKSFGRSAEAGLAAAHARLAAASGMDYAAARLAEDSYPRYEASASVRGDDWRSRSGAPSYDHGEPWIDSALLDANLLDDDADGLIDEAGEGDGLWTAGEAFADADRDGRRGAFSGRLRGGRKAADTRFSLSIETREGRIPLNAGSLNGFLDADGASGPNGIPDHRDVQIQYHASLVQILNNLGATLADPSGTTLVKTRRWEIPASKEPVLASWLGKDLLSSRPEGGYRSWEEVRRTLLNLDPAAYPGGPYTEAEIEAIRPYIDLGPYETFPEASRCRPDQVWNVPRYAPICFATAPRDVLRSVWMYLAVPSPAAIYRSFEMVMAPGADQWVQANDFLGEAAGWGLLCPHSGLPFGPPFVKLFGQSGDYAPSFPVMLILFPDEAAALAKGAALYRQQGRASWSGWRDYLHLNDDWIFAKDYAVLDTPGTRSFKWSWVASKAGLAYQAAATAPYPIRGSFGAHAAWATGGVDADRDSPNVQSPPAIGFEEIRGIKVPAAFDPLNPAPWGASAGDANRPYNEPWGGPAVKPQGFTLGPPVRFAVAGSGRSSGAEARIEGDLRAAERLELACQEDFENLTGGTRLAAQGISASEILPPPARHDCQGGLYRPRTATLPRWNWRGLVPDADALLPPYNGFSRVYGGVTPAARRGGRGTAQLYWPLAQDFDAQEPADAGDFWSENDPTYTYSPGVFPNFPPVIAPHYRIPPAFSKPETPWTSGPGSFSSAVAGERRFNSTRSFDTFPAWDLQFQCPGFDPYLVKVGFSQVYNDIKEFAVEGWIGQDACLKIGPGGVGNPSPEIALSTQRAWQASPDRPGTLFRLRVAWQGFGRNMLTGKPYSGVTFKDRFQDWFLEDDPAVGAVGSHHFRLSMERVGASVPGDPYKSRFTLSVDGAALPPQLDFWDPNPAVPFPANSGALMVPVNSGIDYLTVRGVGELRFYSSAFAAGILGDRYEPVGVFTSPLYVCDGGVRPVGAQWHAAIPRGMGDPVAVEVQACDAAGNVILSKALPGGEGAVEALRPLGFEARHPAFRYRVLFSCAGAPGPLREAPVFQSIWLALQRPGVAPAWTSWESR